MKNTYPSSILNLLELIIVPFIITSILCMPLLFIRVDDVVYGNVLFLIYGVLVVGYLWLKNKRRLYFDFTFKLPDLTLIFTFSFFIVFLLLSVIITFKSFLDFSFGNLKNVSSVKLVSFYAFGAIFIGPVVEEFIFRGIILSWLTRNYGNIIAIVISSVLFALIHIQPAQMIFAMIMGLLFGFVFVKTGSLSFVILLHSIANLTSIVIGEYLVKSNSYDSDGIFLIYGEWTFLVIGVSVLGALLLAVNIFKKNGFKLMKSS